MSKNNKDNRLRVKTSFYSMVMGFYGGLVISFVCFVMLPFAIKTSYSIFGVSFGLIAGIGCAIFIDKKKNIKEIVHYLAEGIAISGVMIISKSLGIKILIVVCLHFTLELIASFITLKKIKPSKINFSIKKIALLALIYSLPLLIGYATGFFIPIWTPLMLEILVSVASGIILYSACGDILPDNGNKDNDNKAKIFSLPLACLGLLFGAFLLSI